jgi:hypothetical protein
METADDRGSASRRLRAFMPLLICLVLLLAGLGWLLHASQARRARITFSLAVDGSPAPSYTATVNGVSYQSGDPCGLGSKTVTIDVPNAEPFRTNVFIWYSGASFGTINVPHSKGTLVVEVAPSQNKVSIRGERFQKELSNCTTESIPVPVGNFEVTSQFEHFRIEKRIVVGRNSTTTVSIRPSITTIALRSDPPDAEFQIESRNGFPISLRGKTPVSISGLPIGKYHLNSWRGKFLKELSVDLNGDPTNSVGVIFDYAKVNFKSEPPGAEIRNGNESLGRTPNQISFIPGSYRVTIQREGYFPKELEFEVKGNEQREFTSGLSNIAFVESFNRAESTLNQFNPDFALGLKEIAKALEIQPGDSGALKVQDELFFRQLIVRVEESARNGDVPGALKLVNQALEKRPSDQNALTLKTELETRRRQSAANAAEERRQRPGRAFKDYTGNIKHSELFDTQKITVKQSSDKALAAISQVFAKDKLTWTKHEKSLGNGISVFDVENRGLISKQRVLFLVGQITDDACEVYFKLWQYKLSGNVQIINGKMTEDSWSPVHPNFSSWAADVVNRQRARDIDAIHQKLETELKSQ